MADAMAEIIVAIQITGVIAAAVIAAREMLK